MTKRNTGTPKRARAKAKPKPKAKAKKKATPKPRTAFEAVEQATPKVNFSKLPAWPRTDQFLHALLILGNVSAACKAAAVGRTTVYRRRQQDEEFAVAWHEIEEQSTDAMEREAYRRAVEGVDKPVYQKGERVGTIREYSDTLLIFMLKGRKPETYRERVDHRHSGEGSVPSRGIDVSRLSLSEARKLRELLAKATPEAKSV